MTKLERRKAYEYALEMVGNPKQDIQGICISLDGFLGEPKDFYYNVFNLFPEFELFNPNPGRFCSRFWDYTEFEQKSSIERNPIRRTILLFCITMTYDK